MSFTYGDDPGISTAAKRRDAVRTLTGDTNSTDPQLTDNQVAFYLTYAGDSASWATVYIAALQAARAILSKYARATDYTSGKTSVSQGQRIKAYQALVEELLAAVKAQAYPEISGQSIAVNRDYLSNSDAVQPAAIYGQDFTPGTGPSSVGGTNLYPFPSWP